MRSLDDIADDLVYVLADDMDEGEFARVSAMAPAERVRYCYVSGDCDVFAEALHRVTGWPIVGVSSPSRGPIHRLVRSPEGRLLDAAGWIDEDGLKKRYGLRRLDLSEQKAALASLFSVDENGVDDQIANAVAAIRQFPWAPFCDDAFRQVSMRLVEGADPSPSI